MLRIYHKNAISVFFQIVYLAGNQYKDTKPVIFAINLTISLFSDVYTVSSHAGAYEQLALPLISSWSSVYQ